MNDPISAASITAGAAAFSGLDDLTLKALIGTLKLWSRPFAQDVQDANLTTHLMRMLQIANADQFAATPPPPFLVWNIMGISASTDHTAVEGFFQTELQGSLAQSDSISIASNFSALLEPELGAETLIWSPINTSYALVSAKTLRAVAYVASPKDMTGNVVYICSFGFGYTQ